ncbi:unnamed protein product [Penicillium pancosmium]
MASFPYTSTHAAANSQDGFFRWEIYRFAASGSLPYASTHTSTSWSVRGADGCPRLWISTRYSTPITLSIAATGAVSSAHRLIFKPIVPSSIQMDELTSPGGIGIQTRAVLKEFHKMLLEVN